MTVAPDPVSVGCAGGNCPLAHSSGFSGVLKYEPLVMEIVGPVEGLFSVLLEVSPVRLPSLSVSSVCRSMSVKPFSMAYSQVQ